MNEQIKIQPRSSIAYVSIVKEKVKSRNTEFYTYKSKQERSFKIVLKHIHVTANLDDIKKEIEDLEHSYYMEYQDTRHKALHMFYIELKQKSNNKDIYESINSLLDCRVKFEQPYSKREISQ